MIGKVSWHPPQSSAHTRAWKRSLNRIAAVCSADERGKMLVSKTMRNASRRLQPATLRDEREKNRLRICPTESYKKSTMIGSLWKIRNSLSMQERSTRPHAEARRRGEEMVLI